jgi:hypothetical protein
VDVPVTLNNASAITHLYLRCNSCGYDDIADNRNSTKTKATVRINGGVAIALKYFIDDNGTVIGNTRHYRSWVVKPNTVALAALSEAFVSLSRFLPINCARVNNTLRFEHVTPCGAQHGLPHH